MSSVAALASTLVSQQAQMRQQTMATVAVKQNAQQEQAMADMLQAAAQTGAGAVPAGQGQSIDLRA